MSRLVAQLVIAAAQNVFKAFSEAYRQAVINAAKNGGQAHVVQEPLIRRGVVSLDEAAKILNVDRTAAYEDVVRNFDHLFRVNDKSVNGSFYLQSKVVRAKERFELEWGEQKLYQERGPIAIPKIAKPAAEGEAAASK